MDARSESAVQGALPAARRPLLVCDTNVIVGALFRRGSRTLLDYWRARRYTLLVTPPIETEYRAILPRFQRIHGEAVAAFFEDLAAHALRLPAPASLRLVGDDPADNKFLDCAVAYGADALVSADRHLHAVQAKVRVAIERPGRVLERLGAGWWAGHQPEG